jgi:heme exporter protein C
MCGGTDMKGLWWKSVSVILIVYSIIAGFIVDVPEIGNLGDSIRNIFFHTCMWFVMIVMLTISAVSSIRYLSSGKIKQDALACEAVNIAVVFGILGLLTGSVWAKYTWGQWWLNDPKLNGAAVAITAYLAYAILRNAISGDIKKARISAVYNLFSYVLFILFMLVLPKLSTGSIHPGDGADSSLPIFTLDNNMRLVFYPAIIGWIMFAVWILDVKVRIRKIKNS